MSEHQSFAATATRLIAKHGRLVDLVEKVKAGDAWNPTITETVTPVKAVNVGFDKLEIDRGLVQVGDQAYLVDSVVPITSDMSIIDGGETFSVYRYRHIKPGDQSILYRVHARK